MQLIVRIRRSPSHPRHLLPARSMSSPQTLQDLPDIQIHSHIYSRVVDKEALRCLKPVFAFIFSLFLVLPATQHMHAILRRLDRYRDAS